MADEELVFDILDHIKVIHELSGIEYILRRDSKYGWAIWVRLSVEIRVFRGSLEKLNTQLANLEKSARHWADYLDEHGNHVHL